MGSAMRRTHLLSLLASLSLTACVDVDSSSSSLENGHGGDDEECGCKIEGSDIGVVGALVHVGGDIVVFESWTPKADSPGEFVGFTLSPNAASISYVVKTGIDRYPATGVAWSHPGGASGPGAPGISNVDFCDEDGDGEPDDGGDLPDID